MAAHGPVRGRHGRFVDVIGAANARLNNLVVEFATLTLGSGYGSLLSIDRRCLPALQRQPLPS
jgi:hypothetical protein